MRRPMAAREECVLSKVRFALFDHLSLSTKQENETHSEHNLRSFEGDQLYTVVQPAFFVGLLIGGSRVARNTQEQFTRSTRLQMWDSVSAAKVERCFPFPSS